MLGSINYVFHWRGNKGRDISAKDFPPGVDSTKGVRIWRERGARLPKLVFGQYLQKSGLQEKGKT